MSAPTATAGSGGARVTPPTNERPSGTLPLPNVLAYVIAAFAVVVSLSLPFAIAASGLSLTEAVDGYYVQSCVLFALLGAVILRRRPGHVIGWLLVAIGGVDVLRHLVNVYLLLGLHERPGWLSGEVVYTLFGWTWAPAVAGIAIALPQFLPDGRLLSPRWRTLAVAGVVATVLLSVADALRDLMDVPDWVESTAYLLFGLLMLVSLVPLFVRFWRSTGIERQQLKWIFLGLAISAPLMGIGVVGTIFGDKGAAFTIAPLVIMPVAITVAVVRYRLYDIDVLINKSVVFVVLAAFITGVYAVIVVGLGRLLPIGEGNLGLAIAATALVAVAFEPVRVRVQHWANRLIYGRRATPYEALAAMTARIGESADPGAALGEAARLLAEGTGAAQAVIWVADEGRLYPRGTAGTLVEPTPVPVFGSDLPAVPGADLTQAVRHEGQLVGALTLTKRPGEGVSSADRRLVEELAGQAALLLANTRLRSRLRDRLEELRASRQRMLAAQDRARRSLERDLHDGAQQELVALKVRLGLARTIATKEGASDLAVELADAATVADRAVDTLRDVARGIYPPLLESEGLAAALSAQAGRAELSITLLDRAGRRYSREVEATTYFCVVEALQNAVRHARAEHAHIELDGTESSLTVTVSDDGCGFDPETARLGSGLTHMTDRANAAGGTLTIGSDGDHGTTVAITLPAGLPVAASTS